MKQCEKITSERFSLWAVELSDMQAVPMLLIATGIGPGHHLCGQIICINSQGRKPEEVLSFLKSVIVDLEGMLQ